ncbi:serine hydrolase domain-containing protein [Leptospira ilyithenensis]|uniref:serine hydrolase domain-containing protein n=1 Tax=Leptospira ilyithenensis TaxID=2484901 RepID=UPI0014386D1E|nr:serine hydrolase [Leptospira ilyithenensis]
MLREYVEKNNRLHSVLIERHGKLIAEIYHNGKDSPLSIRYGFRLPFDGESTFDKETLHDVRSVSKSVVSLLFGIALEKKLIPEIDASVLSSFPELDDLGSVQHRSVTWRHLLTMSGGLDWKEWGRGFLTNDEARLYWKKDLVRFVFERPIIEPAGKVFNYNGGGTSVLAEILTKETEKSLDELAAEWLFHPIGINEYEWVKDRYGRALAFGGLRLRPRDMLKLGRLMLNGGIWEKKQIVPNQWIMDSLKPHISTNITMLSGDESPVKYGYQWWIGETYLPNRRVSWQAALGNGGQRIYIVPDLDLVVVTTAGEYGSAGIGKEIGMLLDKIIATAN